MAGFGGGSKTMERRGGDDKAWNLRLPEKNRLFFKDIDGTKLFTQRYVNKLKEGFREIVERFVVGANYALGKQKDEIMAGARKMVMDTHNKVTGAFE